MRTKLGETKTMESILIFMMYVATQTQVAFSLLDVTGNFSKIMLDIMR